MSLANRAPVGVEAFHCAVVRLRCGYSIRKKSDVVVLCVCVCVCVLAQMGEMEGVGTWTIGAERVSEGAHTCAVCIRTCDLRGHVF